MEISEIKTLDDALAVIRQLLEIVKKQGDEIAKLREENEKLRQENAWLKRQLFGSKAEHYIPTDDTPSLFPEEESPAQPEESPSTTVSGHERKVRQANALSEIPADLPREERVIDVPEDQRQGMKLIGYAESERIAYRTGLYVGVLVCGLADIFLHKAPCE